MRAMVVGLPPDYVYPGTLAEWRSNNTHYAANCGACLITNALMRQFGAAYVDDFSEPSRLNREYELCVLALATHVHPTRDVTFLADLVEQLEMPVLAPSLGIADYATDRPSTALHPSVLRLLRAVSARSRWIGARGPQTASVLWANGFENVIPIGCPSVFFGLKAEHEVHKPARVARPLIVFHRAMARHCPNLLREVDFLGQDYEDQAVFTNDLPNDRELQRWMSAEYAELPDTGVLDLIRSKGLFYASFQKWFETIGERDFVFGPRLHGCIAALVQGIPAVMTPRDLRTSEISRFLNIPAVPIAELKSRSIQTIFEEADYAEFKATYRLRYRNYLRFLAENGVEHYLEAADDASGFVFQGEDIQMLNGGHGGPAGRGRNVAGAARHGLRVAGQNVNRLCGGIPARIPFAKRLFNRILPVR